MTAKDLKNALLQEAVQGKLVPQIASEGNAKDLLEEIKKEKVKLIKEGKLKKEKPLPEITEDEIPFDIPENWCWCRLGEIVSILGDGIHGTPNYDIHGKYYFINGNNLSDGNIIIKPDTKKVNEDEYQKYKKELNENTVFVSINGTLGNIAFYNDEKIILGKSACYFNLINNTMKNFIYWIIKTTYFIDYATQEATGTTIKNVSLATMRNLPIPLPPLAEQKRIVAAIEQFMPLIEEYGKKEAELTVLNADIAKTLKNAILQEAVQGKLTPQIASEGNAKDLLEEIKKEKAKLIKEGKFKKEKPLPEIIEEEIPFDIPENWCWCRLGDIVDTNIGLTYSPSDIVDKNGMGVLRSNNIKNGKIVYDDLVHVSKKVPVKCLANKGDLLICARNGSRALVGKSALIEEDGMAFGAFMAIVRSRFTPYIRHFINSPVYRAKLEGVNTTTINQITQDNLRETLIPLPPFEEQKRIVDAIEKLLPYCEKIGE